MFSVLCFALALMTKVHTRDRKRKFSKKENSVLRSNMENNDMFIWQKTSVICIF